MLHDESYLSLEGNLKPPILNLIQRTMLQNLPTENILRYTVLIKLNLLLYSPFILSPPQQHVMYPIPKCPPLLQLLYICLIAGYQYLKRADYFHPGFYLMSEFIFVSAYLNIEYTRIMFELSVFLYFCCKKFVPLIYA
jgi:hypothetical protein